MRALIQRVNEAAVTVEGETIASIGRGLLVFLGISSHDTGDDIEYLSKKIAGLRIFSDEEGKMNLNVTEVQGSILLVSQFTLFASTKKGNRPSFIDAAPPEIAVPLYEQAIVQLEQTAQVPLKTGKFGADMKVALQNDGPVTLWLDSRNRY
ncbi:MAG: D-tyrosyl-tRNA(Tyr) deacylase [Bacteroidetes bacterium]|nr:D-tyrosyl-tRNA(Tyr) deacylase [Bacteroidota bacterium]